jgi:tetratricopeptide (TPR) repeat protein
MTAKKMCDALEHFAKALSVFMQRESLTENQENAFVNELSQCYRIEHIVAQIPSMEMRLQIDKIVDRVLHRCSTDLKDAASQLDEDARICYAVLHMDSKELIAQFLLPCKQKYPKSIYFFELSSAVNGWLGQYETTLYDANTGLELDPNYYGLLYDKAVALRLIGKDMDEAINAYQAFLAMAPRDHRKVPESYYAMASCYFMHDKQKDIADIIKKIYQEGEEAEKVQLPCFLPYDSNSKTLVKHVLDAKSLLNAEPGPITDRKVRLKNPHRIEVILKHRQWQAITFQQINNSDHSVMMTTRKLRVKQQTAKSLIGLKPISLREMNPVKDHIYNGYVLSITIIEEAYSWTPSIHLVIEDENLDCERIFIYGFPEGQGEYLTSKVYTIGSKMNIINPYLRIGANDMKPLIRIDDFSSIMMQNESERVINMCRCCGEPNAPNVCGKCKQARYCTKECQTMDWKLYKHKLICKNQ